MRAICRSPAAKLSPSSGFVSFSGSGGAEERHVEHVFSERSVADSVANTVPNSQSRARGVVLADGLVR
jgi:hypothetical protein